ncbi:MAG: Gfo/Idh/MocA family protein [Chloroflexota bacterium]
MVRVLQIGVGGFGRSWADLASAAPGIGYAGAVDPDPAARAWARDELGLPGERLFPSFADALLGAEFEAVLLATPPATHHVIGLQAIAAGRHVLVEKPLAATLDDAATLVAAAAAAGTVLMVSQNYRHRPPARAMQAAIREGAVGRLVAVRCAHRRDTRTLFPPGNFRYAMRHPLVIDMAIHHMDLLRMLTGQEVTALDARGWRVPDSPYLHDPAVAALLTLADGTMVRYEGDWATHGPETSWNGEWEVMGEDGVLRWTGGVDDALTGRVTLERWGESPRELPLPELPFRDRGGTLEAFRRAVEEGIDPETSGRDNLGSLRIVFGMAEAVERAEPPARPGLPGR